MYLEIFLADFGLFRGISQKSLNFAGPRPREISEALNIIGGIAESHPGDFLVLILASSSLTSCSVIG